MKMNLCRDVARATHLEVAIVRQSGDFFDKRLGSVGASRYGHRRDAQFDARNSTRPAAAVCPMAFLRHC
jgi:hypothetical protein